MRRQRFIHRVCSAIIVVTAFFFQLPAHSYPGDDCDEQQQYCSELGYGEVRCVVPTGGMFGDGPFVCSQVCQDGTSYDPFECEIWPDSLAEEGDNPTGTQNWPCRGEVDCPYDVVGAYQTCGGIVWPFMVDDDDNLYFWTARGRLHSIDRTGVFRWRFELCAPEPDYYSENPKMRQSFPSVMDYHGDIFFFSGDELFAISGDGEVLLQRRIRIPGIRPEPTGKNGASDVPENLVIQSGEENHGAQSVYRIAGEPVLTTDGRIFAIFALWTSNLRQSRQGILELNRVGEVLNVYLPFDSPDKDSYLTGLVIDSSGRVVFQASVQQNPAYATCETENTNDTDYEAYTVTLDESDVTFSEPWSWGSDRPDSGVWLWGPDLVNNTAFAVAPDGDIYGVSNWFRLSRFTAGDPLEYFFSMYEYQYLFSNFNSFTKPVISPDGTLYVEQDLSPGRLWAINLEAIGDPLPADTGNLVTADETTQGVKWRWDTGGYAGGIAGTPVVTESGNIYFSAGTNIVGLDVEGEELWRHVSPSGVYPGAMAVLSDGTLVANGTDAYVYFLKEKYLDNGGLAQGGWPRAHHDNYHSNNASHPIRWDRSGPAPYPRVTELLEGKPDDWSCSSDDRCYPSEYYDTCDWGGTYDWAGKEVDPCEPGAVCTPCPDPRATPCTVPGIVPADCDAAPECEDELDGGADDPRLSATNGACSCNTNGWTRGGFLGELFAITM